MYVYQSLLNDQKQKMDLEMEELLEEDQSKIIIPTHQEKFQAFQQMTLSNSSLTKQSVLDEEKVVTYYNKVPSFEEVCEEDLDGKEYLRGMTWRFIPNESENNYVDYEYAQYLRAQENQQVINSNYSKQKVFDTSIYSTL